MSYQQLWSTHMARYAPWKSHNINMATRLTPDWRTKWTSYDIIILTPSIYSNSKRMSPEWEKYVEKSKAFKIYIIGNEYKLIPEKMNFCNALRVNLVLSMLNPESIERAYKGFFGQAEVTHWLFSATDPEHFYPGPPLSQRHIDFGYRATKGAAYAGHQDREDIPELFENHPLFSDHTKDISQSPNDRMMLDEWANFLRSCRFSIGSESGVDYFDPTDGIRKQVNLYTSQNPNYTFEELKNKFFTAPNPISGRMASSRNFETCGTKTIQIQYEGLYSHHLIADKHYIPIKRDLSNLNEIIEKMNDSSYLNTMADVSYEFAMKHHTYEVRVHELSDIIDKKI